MKVFFYGSPGDGFNSFPSEFTYLVKGLDSAEEDNFSTCVYQIKNGNTIIKYTEYGLSGINVDYYSTRGGRNFGLYIEMSNKLNKKGQNKVVKYIENFFEAIRKSNTIFDKEKQKKFFKVVSFDEYRDKLVLFLNDFKKNFIEDFSDFFEIIEQGETYQMELLKKPSKQRVIQDIENDNHNYQPDFTSHINKKKKNIKSKRLINKNSLILLILSSFFFLTFLFNLWNRININSNSERINLLEKQKSIPVNNSYKNTPIIKEEPKQEIKEEKKTEKQEPKNTNKKQVTVKENDNLRRIVIDYNEKNNTNFSTKKIAEFNHIKLVTKKNKKGVEYSYYNIHPNDVIKFP